MGRAFEFRKARKFKRWDKMSKAFTRIGKEIVMAVKESGPNPDTNSRLRAAIQNAKGVNMPKDRVEAAIKRASSKEERPAIIMRSAPPIPHTSRCHQVQPRSEAIDYISPPCPNAPAHRF